MHWNFGGFWGLNNYASDGVLGDFYTAEFHSTGVQWYITLRNSVGTALLTTDPVLWSGVQDTGESYWFYMGIPSTANYYADMEIDSIDMTYTPE